MVLCGVRHRPRYVTIRLVRRYTKKGIPLPNSAEPMPLHRGMLERDRKQRMRALQTHAADPSAGVDLVESPGKPKNRVAKNLCALGDHPNKFERTV